MDIIVKDLESSEEYDSIRILRTRVFVNEQGVPADLEFDEYDKGALHAVAYNGPRIVGTGRLIVDSDTDARIGRMAVEESSRRFGIGSRILLFLEDSARSQGVKRLTLHAQYYVKNFYQQNGYAERGNNFMEAGILHVEMIKYI